MEKQEIVRRYPHLIKALCWVGILSRSEATSAIWAHQHNMTSGCACEAVAHWCAGGPVAPIIARAFACRHIA